MASLRWLLSNNYGYWTKPLPKIIAEKSIIKSTGASNFISLLLFYSLLKIKIMNKMAFEYPKILSTYLMCISLDSIIDNDIFVSA